MNSSTERMPVQVWILTLAAFAIGTAEFVIAGILTQVSASLAITEGQAGNLITAYAVAIVIGGPVLTLWLARYDQRRALIGLLCLFLLGNLISALTDDYALLIVSRVITGLTQGPFYGIGAVVATELVSEAMAGRAVGQMFAGLTLANVLGVPAGTWIGNRFGWHATFAVVAVLGVVAMIAVAIAIRPAQRAVNHQLRRQLSLFRNPRLLGGLLITVLCWSGFMSFYGYIAPIAQNVAHFSNTAMTWILVVVGAGLIVGNSLGGRSADRNLHASLLFWPAAMVVSLLLVGLFAGTPWLFVVTAFVFGVTSFANVPVMQLRVMQHGQDAPELAATANISAFNLANAIGGALGGLVVDSSYGAAILPYVATLIPLAGIVFVALTHRRGARVSG